MRTMKMISLILLSLVLLFTASAYVVYNEDDTPGIVVPQAVQQKVRELFPGASDIEWEKERKGNYEAEFTVKGCSIELLLDEHGNVLELQKEIGLPELPSVITAELDKMNFLRVARVEYVKQGSDETYRIIGLTSDKRYRMSYDANGKLLSETVLDRNKKYHVNIAMHFDGASSYEKKWELPFILKELSGIALVDDHRMACVQDEVGSIFIYDLDQSKIVSEIPFGPPGDHEGVTLVNDDAWILRSDGKLYQVKKFLSKRPKIYEHILNFGYEQNLEGICYDRSRNCLLIAPREYDTENIMYKGIYSFDLSAHKLSDEPVFRIKMEDPILSEVDPRPGRAPLMPSAIGIHPATGKIYITDARNSQVLVVDHKGKPLKLFQLNRNIHQKTEGIAFTASGGIYLSNEGKKQGPNIVLLKKGTLE